MVSRNNNIITNARLGIFYFVQNEILSKFCLKEELKLVGLSPRFLPFYIPSDINQNVDGRCEQYYKLYKAKIRNMIEYFYVNNSEREMFDIVFSQDALEEVLLFEKHAVQLQKLEEYKQLESYLSKSHGKVVSLASIFHVYKYFDTAKDIPVELDSVLAAISIIYASFQHANFAFNPNENKVLDVAHRIVRWVKQHKLLEFTSRNVQQQLNNLNSELIANAIDLLEKHNYLRYFSRSGKGIDCVVNPSLLFKDSYDLDF